ncbi:MAG: methyltransferase domain-containing protein [Alphaproteobacteria bacterium]|nr:methyltransferase domain-containing protein [Alphaproteobacteria bacterium]
MPRPPTGLDRLAYTASQAARFGWFYSQYRRAQRRVSPAMRKADVPEGMPTTRDLLSALFELFRTDLANIEAGHYAMPPDMWPRPDRVLRTNRDFFRDLSAVDRRRRAQSGDEIFRRTRDDDLPYPRYFLQNFHFQSDGYLSDESAAIYDYQVEILFSGGADAMRRQALVPLSAYLRGRSVSQARMLDVACGTGRLLGFTRDAHPLLRLAGIDLSPNYVAQARRRALRGLSAPAFLVGNAETLPFADESQDIVSNVFLFHELPPKVRRIVAREMARVLKPGGLLLHVDSLQTGDRPAFDPLLGFFPQAYHEPYYASYVATDLDALFEDAGLTVRSHTPAFLSKVSVYAKPG